MPWKVCSVMEKRAQFIEEWAAGVKSKTELCADYGISRKTGYAIWERFVRDGADGLADGSRRPQVCPHQTCPQVEERLVELREKHPRWGPKKLRALLASEGFNPPALSTIGAILKRRGLSQPQKRRFHGLPTSPPLIVADEPNLVWSTDFKGQFYVGSGERCDPLTVMDGWSRYLLGCHGYFQEASQPRLEEVMDVYRDLFRTYGLPRYILSDNGGPFASTAPGGLTKLSAFWITLGITPIRIASGKPQQNGRLERLHRTLKSEVALPPGKTVAEQKEKLTRFAAEYNTVRPHEALGQKTPASVYRAGKPWDGLVPDPVFPEGAKVCKVPKGGALTWNGRTYQMPTPLIKQFVGVVPEGTGKERVSLFLNMYCVGMLVLSTGAIMGAPRNAQLLKASNDRDDERALPVRQVTLDGR